MSGLSMAHRIGRGPRPVVWAPMQSEREVAEAELIPTHQLPQRRIAQVDRCGGL